MSDDYDEAESIDISDEYENGGGDEISDEVDGDDGEKDQEGEASYKHIQQTASGHGDGYDKFDAISKAVSEFETAMKKLSCNNIVNMDNLKKHLKDNIPRLATLNMDLLALAVCFNAEYKTMTNDSVTKFIKRRCKGLEPIDVIRYLNFYHAHRMDV